MKILVLGADGYLGWPTTMYFAAKGHEVLGIDNYIKRQFAAEVNEEPLFPIKTLQDKIKYWNIITKSNITKYAIGDITNYEFLSTVIKDFSPDCIIHYAEQPSSPWSMFSYENAKRTIENNLIGTFNVAWAVKEINPDIHIIKLGTSGEYGSPNTDIPEGFFEYEYRNRKETRLYPREGPSIYHTTKIQDTDLLHFFVRTWGLKVTDLMQGPVLGIVTEEMLLGNSVPDHTLFTSFHYGEHFGTVLNRFVVQAICDYPLTVYGKGGQTRGYLNIKDTVQCINLAAETPPESGKLRIMNQMTEVFTVNELANRVQIAGTKLGLDVKISNVPNPRKEAEEHYYNPEYSKLLNLGLQPNYLTADVIMEMMQIVQQYRKQIKQNTIFNCNSWNT
jgi:UDP-sulfoquinovose synthase